MKADYVLTAGKKHGLQIRGLSVICPKCGCELAPGDVVHRQVTGSRARYFHSGCWASLFFESSDSEQSEVEKLCQSLVKKP
jgi:hypothetical protein